ncbi:MAG: uridine kinase [Oscillospiraceae bacterium]|nr:uridine kinase [Oscillospiraceae bacterium]
MLLFLGLLALKLICMGVFSSGYQNEMFEPFLENFLRGLKSEAINPYQSFYEQGIPINFPYPPVMLLIMSLGEGLSMLFSGGSLFLHNVLFKLPLLVIDVLIFAKLCKMYPEHPFMLLIVYFGSPVILYATYMHGQLDIVPMSFLFLSLLALTGFNVRRRYVFSALLLSLALLSKFHIVAVLPVIAIYILKKSDLRHSLLYCLCVLAVTVLGVIPFWGEGFFHGVLLNSAQSSLFGLFFSYGSLNLYLSITAIILIYFYTLNLNFINADLLFGLCGLLFSVFLALCAPMPGWYLWVMLFLADFVIRSNGYKHSFLCFALLQAFYLCFFLFFHKANNGAVDLYWFRESLESLKSEMMVLKNISFSFLSATLAYLIWLMHKFSIAGNSLYRFHDKSFVFGICGDSSTGKTTLQSAINQMLGSEKILCIEGDGDHKWERGDAKWNTVTHLNPRANYLYRQARDIRQLKAGNAVKRVEYNHETGRFTEKHTVYPRRFISISGLHILFLPQLRDIIDLKIYTEADEELRIFWKTNRDMNTRGYSAAEILKQIRSRYEDAHKYIYPQKEYADLIFHYFRDEESGIGMEIRLQNKINVDQIVDLLSEGGVRISYEFSDDFHYQVMVFRPSENRSVSGLDYERLFMKLFPQASDMFIDYFSASNLADCIQKMILARAISSKLREDI